MIGDWFNMALGIALGGELLQAVARQLHAQVGSRRVNWPAWEERARFCGMSSQPPRGLLADALQLPAQDRLALASVLIDSVEGANDADWDDAWLAELDRRSQGDLSQSDDWATVRARLLNDLRSK
jgi:hypothetical protein